MRPGADPHAKTISRDIRPEFVILSVSNIITRVFEEGPSKKARLVVLLRLSECKKRKVAKEELQHKGVKHRLRGNMDYSNKTWDRLSTSFPFKVANTRIGIYQLFGTSVYGSFGQFCDCEVTW
jgi:hypothetical protein